MDPAGAKKKYEETCEARGVAPDPAVEFFGTAAEAVATAAANAARVAVVIATPARTHASVFFEVVAMPSVFRILVEKPIALRQDEARRMAEAAAAAGVDLRVGHTERFNPAARTARETLPLIGRPLRASFVRRGPAPAADPGVSVALDLAVHDADLANFLLPGALPPAVTFGSERHSGAPHAPSGADMFAGGFTTAAGVLVDISADWVTPAKLRAFSIAGTAGLLTVDLIEKTVHLASAAAVDAAAGLVVGEARAVKVADVGREPIVSQAAAFVRETLADLADARAGAAAVGVVNAWAGDDARDTAA